MQELLGTGIKQIIDEYPEVGTILQDYKIGCVPCNVGTCLLKDIVDIHNLPPELEQEMMTRIAKAVYPEREVSIPLRESTQAPAAGELKYSPPMKRLVDEHVLIKRLVALIPSLIETMDLETESGRQVLLDAVDFIRSYADKYHHAKEEDILFKYFDENLDILKVIREDHETARAHVRALVEAVEKREPESAAEHLSGYRELLTEHIKKEDEILYPWMDRELTDGQIGQIFSQFHALELTFGDAPAEYGQLITKLEEAHR
ncbi:MAG: hemerythrin domain-containing protein [Kiritimatiellia bacterium]|jgi:hemerythrin-like domain-containing protein|nr:hemerythrin domain-containing protein [Kiritimatiellia bacterium]